MSSSARAPGAVYSPCQCQCRSPGRRRRTAHQLRILGGLVAALWVLGDPIDPGKHPALYAALLTALIVVALPVAAVKACRGGFERTSRRAARGFPCPCQCRRFTSVVA